MAEPLTFEQRAALLAEAESTRVFLDQALGLVPGTGEEDRRVALLQMLALGVEKLFKLTFCLGRLGLDGNLPDQQALKAIGHSLLKGRDAVCEVIRDDSEYMKRGCASLDLAFLEEGAALQQCLKALSDWGSQGRYRDLTLLVSQGAAVSDPITDWLDLENTYLLARPDYTQLMATASWKVALAEFETALIQQVIRACARLWTLGPCREAGLGTSPILQKWVGVTDAQLHIRR